MAKTISNGGTSGGAFAPLGVPLFRRVWTASIVSNFGQLILGVGAAWEMTRLSSDASLVALVQSALMLPLMLVSLPAGAIADMFDRRLVAMTGLAFAIACASLLTALAWASLTSPIILLMFCALIGAGVALYSPAWQASIPEQVDPAHLPSAVALGSISYNIARSVGPAIGGLIVLAAGAKAAFATNAACYVPLLLAFLFWRRTHRPSRLPPERIDRAIVSGARYALHSEPVRRVFGRALLLGLAGASLTALAPLVARNLLRGDASVYGLLLGASGVGAVIGALLVSRIRTLLGNERAVRLLALVTAASLVAIALSRSTAVTCVALFAAGGANIVTIALLNISVQLSVPRWVTARALSLFSSSLTGGIAVGAWIWGVVAQHVGLSQALALSGGAMALNAVAGRWLRLPEGGVEGLDPVTIPVEPEVGLALTPRSGPIVIEVDYHVEPEQARGFYDAMLKVQRARMRNGGFDWSIARDIADPSIWTERYHCPTWGDFLRSRDRMNESDLAIQAAADAFATPGRRRVRRRLERPFGSVRWKPDSPDPLQETQVYFGP